MESENKLYLECYSGISGDMTVAALLDLGADEKVLQEALESLTVPGFKIEIKRVIKSGIDACDFHVVLDAAHENHDHDMEYLHGHEHMHGETNTHDCEQMHEEANTHGCEYSHKEVHSHHHHEHRGMQEIREIIEKGQMTEGAKKLALKIFEILAQAESKAHNVPVEQVHFHEVGAVDSIVDIVAAAVCLDNLGIKEVVVPVLCEGVGIVRCQHGILPVPVPAVANIMSMYQLPVRIVDAEGEFITPTGAAIVAAVKTSGTLPKDFSVVKTGIGAGKRKYERPGILRAMVIQEPCKETDRIWKLETDIDDCSGEILGYVMERLFEAGARDVHYMPVFMKKNRPAWQLNVICDQKDIEKLEHIMFRETTTIGIRRAEMDRSILKRQEKQIVTPFGEARIKVCQTGGLVRFYPEYDSVSRLAKESGTPFAQVYQMVQKQCGDEM